MTTETFVIKIQQTGAEATAAGIARIGKQATVTSETLAFFRKALVAISAIKIAAGIFEFADSLTLMNNKLRLVSKSSEDFARAQKFIFDVSRETRTEVTANAAVYTRLAIATSELHIKTGDLERVMTTLSKSISIGGATSEEAKHGLIQLAQGMAAGTLRGQDLNSVVEFLPIVARAIGKEFGVAGGQLRNFAKENVGVLSTERVMRALLAASKDVDAQFATTQPTIMQGFIAISNAATEMLNSVNNGTSVLGLMSLALQGVADHLTLLVSAITIFSAVKLLSIISPWIISLVSFSRLVYEAAIATDVLTASMAALDAVAYANPIGVLVLAIAALIAAFVLAYNYIPGVSTAISALWSALQSLGSYIMSALAPAWDFLAVAIQSITPVISAIWETLSGLWDIFATGVAAIGQFIISITPVSFIVDVLKFALIGLAVVITASIIGAFTLFVIAARGVAEALNLLGLVSTETMEKVRTSSDNWFTYVNNIASGGLTFANAAEQQRQLGVAAENVGTSATTATGGVHTFNDGMDELGNISKQPISVLDSLGLTLGTVAPAAERTADSLNKTSEATISLEVPTNAAEEAMRKLNPELFKGEDSGAAARDGFVTAAGGANVLTTSINKLAEAYRKLNAAKTGGGGGGDTKGLTGANAAGGPVRRNGVYLVGEEGPEIFTPGVSGYISSNADSVSMMMGTATNDNSASANVSTGIGGNAARAMAQSSYSVANSVEVIATAIKKWTTSEFKGQGYTGETTAVERAAVTGGSRTTNGFTDYGADYTRPDGRQPLPGDADYVGNYQSWGGIVGNPTGGAIGGSIVYGSQDLNDPSNQLRTEAQLAAAMGDTQGSQALVAMADKLIENLKQIRDNTANLKEFKAMNAADMAAGGPKIDFQTLLPMLGLGGKSMGEHDPYGLMQWKGDTAKATTGHGELATGESNKEPAKVQPIQIVLQGVKDFNSFRNNQAQLDGAIQSAVKRANRRAA